MRHLAFLALALASGCSLSSDSGDLVINRELKRVKRRPTHISEHIREKLLLTKQARDKETQ